MKTEPKAMRRSPGPGETRLAKAPEPARKSWRLAKSASAIFTGCLLLACLGGVLATVFLGPPARVSSGSSAAPALGWAAYWRDGQYLADFRSAVCMWRYLLEPEPGVLQTNSSVRG